jgi:His-Xaa-Ser system protein HxsD
MRHAGAGNLSSVPTTGDTQPSAEVDVVLEVGIYGVDPIAKAAHRFTDRCFVRLEHDDPEHVRCHLRAKRAGDDPCALVGEFENEVLDQMLRARVAAESESLRLLLLAHAFANTNILHPELDRSAPAEDPLRIGEPDPGAVKS